MEKGIFLQNRNYKTLLIFFFFFSDMVRKPLG